MFCRDMSEEIAVSIFVILSAGSAVLVCAVAGAQAIDAKTNVTQNSRYTMVVICLFMLRVSYGTCLEHTTSAIG
jgi:hypothetical protein